MNLSAVATALVPAGLVTVTSTIPVVPRCGTVATSCVTPLLCTVWKDVAGDVCDYPLARNLVLLVVAVASEVLVRFALTGARQDWSVTLGDFAIRPWES